MRPGHLDRLQRPWAILVAATYGCNFACWFCGIQKSFKPKDWHHYEFIDPNLVAQVFTEVAGWLPTVRAEYLIRGEPTLHPQFDEVLRATRTHPTAFIQAHTNGSLIEEWDAFEASVTRWFDAGLNMLVVNSYKRWWGTPKPEYDKYTLWMEYARRYVETHTGVGIVDYYYDNPRHVSPHNYGNPRQRTILIMDDLERMNRISFSANKQWQGNVGNIPDQSLVNMGLPVLTEPLRERCTRPSREMNLEANGCVTICCLDWRKQMIFGRVPDQSMRKIWECDAWCAVRELLWRRNRYMTPCNKCEWLGTRRGLLKPINMEGTDEELLALVERGMNEYVRYTHPSAEVRIGDAVVKPEAPGTFHY